MAGTGLIACSASPATRNDADLYVRRHLNGTGHYTRIVVQDRTIGAPAATFHYTPTIVADRLLVTYVRSRIRGDIVFESTRDLPPADYQATPMEGHAPVPMVFTGGVLYIAIVTTRWRHLPGTQVSEVIPDIHVYGDQTATGGSVVLSEPAPGDVPCQGYCRTAEQTFNAVRGRVDLILRNVSR